MGYNIYYTLHGQKYLNIWNFEPPVPLAAHDSDTNNLRYHTISINLNT